MTLSSRQRTALWTGSGAFIGLALGALLVDATTALGLAWLWILLFAAFIGTVLLALRERPQPAREIVTLAIAPSPASPLEVDIAFPDVPSHVPPVLGVGDPVHVRVTVRGASGDSAAVRLAARLRDGARHLAGEGVTGTDGAVEFTIRPPGVGELVLEADASQGDARGAATRSIAIVRYSEEIERLFHEFRAYAHGVLGPGAEADTARELAERLRAGTDAKTSRALLELARIYELVAYGERDADRALYLALVEAFLVLEQSGEGAPSAALHVEG